MSRVCPTCKQSTRVTDTRYRPSEDYTYRRHLCPSGHTFTTIELIVKETNSGNSLMDKLKMEIDTIDIVKAKRLCQELSQILRGE